MAEVVTIQEKPHFWSWLDVLMISTLALFIIMGGVVLLSLALGLDLSDPEAFTPTLVFSLGVLAVEFVALMASIGVVGVLRNVDWRRLGLRPLDRYWRRVSIVLGIIAIPVTSWIALGVQYLRGQEPYNPQLDFVVPEGFTWGAAIGMTLLIGICIPFAEELAFRGVLYRWLRQHLQFFSAALLSSILFGALHGEISIAAGTAVLGFAAAWVYEKSGSLWAPIIIHAINNGVKVLALYFLL